MHSGVGNPNYRHGGACRGHRHPLYSRWAGMIDRCTNPKHIYFHNYGGRGIVVCERWRDFALFILDMGSTFKPGLTLDRIDNDGNYCPENCRWATPKEQGNKSRINTILTAFGKSQTITQWAEELKIHHNTLHGRLKLGWPLEKVLSKPVRNCGR